VASEVKDGKRRLKIIFKQAVMDRQLVSVRLEKNEAAKAGAWDLKPLGFPGVKSRRGYVGAAATKSVILGLVILATASLFVTVQILHPFWMLAFLILTAVTFSMFGFIIGIWADGFERLQVVPLLILTPLTFLGGTFYSIKMLPPLWQTVTLFNPIVYLISGFRWSFYEISDVNVGMSLLMTLGFLTICLAVIWWIFKTGYRLKA